MLTKQQQIDFIKKSILHFDIALKNEEYKNAAWFLECAVKALKEIE